MCARVRAVQFIRIRKFFGYKRTLGEWSIGAMYVYLQVNLNQPCPFWPDDSTCMTKLCDVKECEEVYDYSWSRCTLIRYVVYSGFAVYQILCCTCVCQ